jgi:hypothetical protein
MRSIIRGIIGDNSSLRGLTGQGEPGLWTLLGGTGAELDSDGYRLGGGPGQVSATSRISRANGDTRVAQVSTGWRPNIPGSGTSPFEPIEEPRRPE